MSTSHTHSQSTVIQTGDSVTIVGGGPAGSFFACYLLQESKRLNRQIDVVIIEKHKPTNNSNETYQLGGCNFCAGGISPRLSGILDQNNFVIPDGIIQGRINYIWVHSQWKNFRLQVPKDQQMYSVFRGSLPAGRGDKALGFDGFLLGEAIKQGARIMQGDVQSLNYTATGMPSLTVKALSGEEITLDSSFVTIATGINAHRGFDYPKDTLIHSVKRLNPAFIQSKSRSAFIFELDVGEEYLKYNMDREIHFIEYGSKRLDLEHVALLPKGRFLSVAMIGKSIDRATLPQDNQKIIREFLRLSQISRILPGIEKVNTVCACFPKMAVTPARDPFGDRFAIIGDAAGARLNKDGLLSAHMTAHRLAQTILHEGIDIKNLATGYGKTIKWLATDNRYGRIVFSASRAAFSWPVISRIIYQSFATEFKVRDEHKRPLGAVLWKIASGTADYYDVLREMISFKVLRSIFIGLYVTLRNVLVEILIGLKWGKAGRYPTLVIKEKRQAVKQDLVPHLGISVNESYDFERMYVIKIRGSKRMIIEELAKFGGTEARFLNLRIIKVQRIRGVPNQIGSVIRYSIPFIGIRTELRLLERSGFRTLLYRLDERLTDNGILAFSVSPTKDGNNKLTIYAAFDYKRGKSRISRIIWRSARALFPKFVHDVVWNHALCTIKEEIEQQKRSSSGSPK